MSALILGLSIFVLTSVSALLGGPRRLRRRSVRLLIGLQTHFAFADGLPNPRLSSSAGSSRVSISQATKGFFVCVATKSVATDMEYSRYRTPNAAACARDTSPTPTRRPINRIDKSSFKPDPALEKSKGEAAAREQIPTVELTLPSVRTVARTPTYRKVNRRQPAAPTTVPDA